MTRSAGRWYRMVLVALLCICRPGAAQTGGSSATLGPFNIWPPYAQVYLATDAGLVNLGSANQKLNIPRVNGSVHLQFEADGFFPYTLVYMPGRGSNLPEQMYLLPTGLWSALVSILRVYPFRCLTLLAVLAALVGRWVRYHATLKAAVRRAEELEKHLSTRDKDNSIATRIGGYRIIRVLGEGGMAVVYEGCRDDLFPDGPRVAIKVIHKSSDNAVEYLQRFKQEIQITAKLSHPGIIRVLDHGEFGGRPYLVMELVLGPNLQWLSRQQPMALDTFLDIFLGVLEAVAFAHAKGVVHRDLKPSNIVLQQDGRPVVMDFGIANPGAGSGKLVRTQTGALLGTPAYMAPEQFDGDPGPLSDQYALGVTAFELLTGTLPIEPGNPFQVMARKLVDDQPGPRSLRPDVSLGLDEIIRRMVDRRPAQRFASLEAVIEAVASMRPGAHSDG